MEDTVFSPKEWQTPEIPSSLNPNSIDQVEDREMGGVNKRRTKVTCSWPYPEKAGVGGSTPSLATIIL